MSNDVERTILKLCDVEGLKFGKFTIRTGEESPVYIDMRVIWTYPDIVKSVANLIWEEVKRRNLEFDVICGLPYQGIPIATYLSTTHDIPMLLKRQQPKSYGTCQTFEGHFRAGDRVLLVDDVLMTGGTLYKDIPVFRKAGLEVVACAVFFDRDQGGAERIKHVHNIDSFSVAKLPSSFEVLLKNNKVTKAQAEETLAYLRSNRFDTPEHGVSEQNGHS